MDQCVTCHNGPLLTDRYQLTMLQAYWQHEMHGTAVFEFFVRKLPPERNFLVAAGLETVLAFLEEFAFSAEDIAWPAHAEHFRPDFLQWLKGVRFTGDVNAMPEGTVFFPNEPILQIIAPLPEAQLVETRLINLLNFQTAVASKAARSILVAPGKLLVEFGLRRAHGADAALMAARACYLVGFQGTSNVLAGRLFGIPLYGTMAHSFIQAHDDEAEAFGFADANLAYRPVDRHLHTSCCRKGHPSGGCLERARHQNQGVRIDSQVWEQAQKFAQSSIRRNSAYHHLRQRKPRHYLLRDRRDPGAYRRLRHWHETGHLLGRPLPKLRLQTAGICRPPKTQAL
jgi:nicotinate phosphoribosyltransferase